MDKKKSSSMQFNDVPRVSRAGKHNRNPGYQPGNHWVVCDVCGFDVRANDARETWDGLVVCPADWEPRHEQDFVRGRQDKIAAEGLVRPPEGGVTYVDGVPTGELPEVYRATGWSEDLKNSSVSLSNEGLTANFEDDQVSVLGERSDNSGKYYWEVLIGNVGLFNGNPENTMYTGFGFTDMGLNNRVGDDNSGWGYYGFNGVKRHSTSQVSFGESLIKDDIVMVALDIDNGLAWFGKNGVWQDSGDPEAGTNAAFPVEGDPNLDTEFDTTRLNQLGQMIHPAASSGYPGGQQTLITTDSGFTYTPPIGFDDRFQEQITFIEDNTVPSGTFDNSL